MAFLSCVVTGCRREWTLKTFRWSTSRDFVVWWRVWTRFCFQWEVTRLNPLLFLTLLMHGLTGRTVQRSKKFVTRARVVLAGCVICFCLLLYFLCWKCKKYAKVKASHTHYWVLGPELIPAYKQSAHRWLCHPPSGRLPLLSASPAVTHPAAEHHCSLAGTKLYCLVTEAHRCEQLAQGCYAAFAPSRIWTHDLLITSPTLCQLCHLTNCKKYDVASLLWTALNCNTNSNGPEMV